MATPVGMPVMLLNEASNNSKLFGRATGSVPAKERKISAWDENAHLTEDELSITHMSHSCAFPTRQRVIADVYKLDVGENGHQ